MTICGECGAMLAPEEKFCGSCGTPRSEQSAAAVAGAAAGAPQVDSAASDNPDAKDGDITDAHEQRVSAAVRSVTTGDLLGDGDTVPPVQPTVRANDTSGKHSKAKQLETGTCLNGRYEIVRRIGGGGMGAVYLARDRNLGDAPRAVKEMIESHIDDSQHEKAISDFKRESLLLTSLEHASIPTIYDYFYDDAAGRFYLVMKYISGGDFSS
jgi:serine/threonine-protein kinase